MTVVDKRRALLAFEADLLSPEGRRRVEARLLVHPEHRRALAEIRALGRLAEDVRRDAPTLALEWADVAAALAARPERTVRLRALTAYAEGMLSEAGRARLERLMTPADHAALAKLRALAQVSEEARQSTAAPDVDFSRMELALRREARRVAAPRRSMWPVAFAAAAAVLFGVWYSQRPAPEPEVARAERPMPTRAPVVHPPLIGEVTALTGSARLGGEPITLGHEVHADARVETEGAVHVRLAEGTGFVLEGAAHMTRLDAGAIELTLGHGRVASQVRTGTDYRVTTGEYEVRVHGTRFTVLRDEDGEAVEVALDEGVVEVLHRGERVEMLHAPARWRSDGALVLEGDVPTPRGLRIAALEASAPIELPASDRFVAWEVDEERWVSGGAPVHLRVPVGPMVLVAFDERDRRYEVSLDVLPEGVAIAEQSLRSTHAPRRGHLDPEVISSVVRPRQRWLRRCYEHTLRRTAPDLGGRFALRVTLAGDGHVVGANVISDQETPVSFARCLSAEARNWQFPSPGGRMHFDLPLRFRTR